ncbi:MAG: lipid-A-disaccharide synthase [Prolixibacteraceae bacterium]|nr:lipid-A-disaccharide synthase [Prolixibacteraceae bacterium]
MKYYLIAGEASGDMHGSNLIKELKMVDKEAVFRFFGGNLMETEAGTGLVKHYREMAFMGIVNVVLNLKTIKRNLNFCKLDLLRFNPDVLILIDYPGFNLRIAEYAKKNNIRVFYYISPKLWAWKEYRIKKIRSFVDEIFTILPFETEYFKGHGLDVHYTGNPLMDSIAGFKERAVTKDQFLRNNNLDDRPVVALLSGSRRQEIKNTLPVMVKAASEIRDFQFVVAGVLSVDRKIYEDIIAGSGASIVFDQTYDLLNNSYAALVASGTAALETALFDVPQAVLYRVEGGWIVHIIMKYFILNIDWVSLPNLILRREAVKEFLQVEMTVRNVRSELLRLLYERSYREKIFSDYKRLKILMGEKGSSKRTAQKMAELLSN